MNWFNKIAERHNEYVKIVRSFPENGSRKGNRSYDNDYIEDIVQDAYIELTELGSKKHKENDKRVNPKYKGLSIADRVLNKDGEVNMVFMWITLKRVSMNLLNKRRKTADIFCRLGEGFDKAEEEVEHNEESYGLLIDKIQEETKKFHWYDEMLFKTYISEEKSMRKLASETGISLTSIFTTIKNCKNRIKENVGEDYQDYNNKDYELIK